MPHDPQPGRIYGHARYTALYDLELGDFREDIPFYREHLQRLFKDIFVTQIIAYAGNKARVTEGKRRNPAVLQKIRCHVACYRSAPPVSDKNELPLLFFEAADKLD